MDKTTTYRKPIDMVLLFKAMLLQRHHSRCLIEHIFGFVEEFMNVSMVRSIQIIRTKASTAPSCLVYIDLPAFCHIARTKLGLTNVQE